jgi:hypothetical protein
MAVSLDEKDQSLECAERQVAQRTCCRLGSIELAHRGLFYTTPRHSTTKAFATTHAIEIMSTQVNPPTPKPKPGENVLNHYDALRDAVSSLNPSLL